MLILFRELITETVIHAHDLLQVYNFYLAFLSSFLGHGEHVCALLLEVHE